MQFVGYANITQDTIYNHMMATATSFFDAATSQSYKRLNLANAFSALMPTDEYGSTAATAHSLGTLSGSSEIHGLIGKLNDADYFRFTAAATGTVTFTATTTHGLAPVWTAVGGTVSGGHGETYSLDVVAGQSYTIGLSSSGGIGYYELEIEAEAAFTFGDWGVVTQSQLNNRGNTGESWYRITASRTGYLTAEALFATAGGNVDLALLDSNLRLVAGGRATAAGERVDTLANAGSTYYIRVAGTNADIDFRLTNLVSLSRATVNVAGTSESDAFTFSWGGTNNTLSVNGASYQFNKNAISTFNFAGGSGSDTIVMTGSTANDSATLRAGNVQLAGSGYVATATGVENVTFHGGGGNDVATFHDTTGNDSLTTWSNRAVMYGEGYWNDARGFGRVYAYASSGDDQACLRDTIGNDVFTSWSDRAVMYGDGYWTDARGFDRVTAFASGGNDQAWLRDSTGDDVFTSWWNRGVMSGAGYSNDARGFDRVYAIASIGNDEATLRDSAGNDRFSAAWDRSVMYGEGYWTEARSFDRVNAYGSTGDDVAEFFDTAGDDSFTSWWDRAIMYGNGYWNDARGFDRTLAHSTGGNDVAVLRDSSSVDEVYASGSLAYITSTNRRNEVRGFRRIDVFETDCDESDVVYLESVDYHFSCNGNWIYCAV
jgi:hypothetical protein